MRQPTDLRYCIQCTDLDSGKTGSFVYHKDAPLRATSPIFDNVSDMFRWMHLHNYESGNLLTDMEVYETVRT